MKDGHVLDKEVTVIKSVKEGLERCSGDIRGRKDIKNWHMITQANHVYASFKNSLEPDFSGK